MTIPANGRNQAGIAGLYHANQVVAVDPQTVRITFADSDGVPTAVPVAPGVHAVQPVRDHRLRRGEIARDTGRSLGKRLAVEERGGHRTVLCRRPDHGVSKLCSRRSRTIGPASSPPFETVIRRITGNADLVSLIKGGVVDYAAEGLTGRQYDALAAAGLPVLHADVP